MSTKLRPVAADAETESALMMVRTNGVNRRYACALLVALSMAMLGAAPSQAQVMFSFEDGLQGWSAVDATLSQTTLGATDGTMALLMTFDGGFKNDVGNAGNITAMANPQAFRDFSLAAAELAKGNRPKLEFDFTIDATNATGLPSFGQLGVFVNSSGGYRDYGTGQLIGGNVGSSFPTIDALAASHGATVEPTEVPDQYHVVIPMLLPDETTTFNEGLSLAAGSSFYQLGFKANGGYGGAISYAIDNIRFTGIPTFASHTLFSWETPDNPGTPDVNEQFEGWVTRNEVPTPPEGVTLQPGHAQTITSTLGATDGAHAYQIDRTSLPSGFTWGSAFALSGAGNPADQARIDDLASRINNASTVAFDITYEDQLPINPTFTKFAIHFADGTGAFYQAETGDIQINGAAPGTTATLEIPIASFNDAAVGSTKNLAVDGLATGATFLEIGLASNTDGGAIYQIDNFRLLTEVPELDPDFNNDGSVDGLDLAIWKTSFGLSAEGDADGDSDTDGNDFLIWQQGLVTGASQAAAGIVPEPSTWVLATLSVAAAWRRRR